MPSLATDNRHPSTTVTPNNPLEEPNRYSPCQFSQNLRMSDSITIISEMILGVANTTLRTAAAAAVPTAERQLEGAEGKTLSPGTQCNIQSAFLLPWDHWLLALSWVCSLLTLCVCQHLFRSVRGFTLVNLYRPCPQVWSQWTHGENVKHEHPLMVAAFTQISTSINQSQ